MHALHISVLSGDGSNFTHQGVATPVCSDRFHYPTQMSSSNDADHSALTAHCSATLQGPRQVEVALVDQGGCGIIIKHRQESVDSRTLT